MRLLDISPAMGLSFVIDTTGSMGEEIKAARRQAWEIIQQRRGTAQEPDQYLLVPFHDPDFGPAYKTSNSEEFLQHLNSISPLAGGDEPEMCLSALQLALLNSPPLSEIFVFTDASAKDRHLKNSVKALIEERRCKVTFLITEDPSRTRVRREILAPDRFDLYVSLALHSGGQVIFTDNNNIWSAAEVIGESAATSVTLFHHQEGGSFVPGESWRRTKRQSRTWRRHQFWIDSLVENVVISVQGDVTNFYIRDPNGKTQLSTLLPRPLATIRSVGTFHRAFLLPPLTVGNWALELLAGTNYSANVQGQSAFDFLYYFAVPFEGPHPGLFKLDSRPVEGLPTFLVVVATGLQPPERGAVRVHGVGLADRAGGKPVAELQLEEGANRTDTFVALLPPALAAGSSFSVILRGTDSHGRKVERNGQQVNTVVGCLMELSSEAPLFPGRPGYVLWKVTNAGSPKKYDLRVSIEPRMPVNISSSW
uniref:von Willebrand factor A domain containing 7 n=1 Tax=Sphenodon punctatus TaxID=8508 RepID=A0A8D0H1J1_SPHPU